MAELVYNYGRESKQNKTKKKDKTLFIMWQTKQLSSKISYRCKIKKKKDSVCF